MFNTVDTNLKHMYCTLLCVTMANENKNVTESLCISENNVQDNLVVTSSLNVKIKLIIYPVLSIWLVLKPRTNKMPFGLTIPYAS